MPKRSQEGTVSANGKVPAEQDAELDAHQLDLSSSDEEEDYTREAGPAEAEPDDDEGSEPDSEEDDEGDTDDDAGSSDDEVGRTVMDLIRAGADVNEEHAHDRQDRTAEAEPAHDPGSDSSEDEHPSRNTGVLHIHLSFLYRQCTCMQASVARHCCIREWVMSLGLLMMVRI